MESVCQVGPQIVDWRPQKRPSETTATELLERVQNKRDFSDHSLATMP